MKAYENTQRGSIGIALIILIAIAAIGGGVYVYNQNEEVKSEDQSPVVTGTEPTISPTPQQTEAKTPVKVEVKPAVSLPAKILKTFTSTSGAYSLSYPSTWTYSEGELAARFQTVTSGASQSLDIGLGTDMDNMVKILSLGNVSEKVTFGANTFTKFTRTGEPHKGSVTYILPVGIVDGQSTFLSVLVEEFTKIDTMDFNSLLGSIKVYPSNAISIVNIEKNIVTSAQIRSYVAGIRANAVLYYDAGGSYSGVCDGSSKKAKDAGIDKVFESILKIVSSDAVHCNASRDAYVYSVRMLSGVTVCSDSTGFNGTITASAKPLSCM